MFYDVTCCSLTNSANLHGVTFSESLPQESQVLKMFTQYNATDHRSKPNENTFHTVPPDLLRSILTSFFQLRPGIPIGPLPFSVPIKTPYAFVIHCMCAACPAHHFFLVLITPIFGKG